MIESPIFLQYC